VRGLWFTESQLSIRGSAMRTPKKTSASRHRAMERHASAYSSTIKPCD
jgi:hypothetical protein